MGNFFDSMNTVFSYVTYYGFEAILWALGTVFGPFIRMGQPAFMWLFGWVTASVGVPDTSYISTPIAAVNYFVPLDFGGLMFTWYVGWKISYIMYKILKSWLPFVSG